jgi:hypothetical protein
MSYTFSLYGLGVVTDLPIPGVPNAPIDSVDLRLHMGKLPGWLPQLDRDQIEAWHTSNYKDTSGNSQLRVFRISDGKYFWYRYSDKTEFLIDQDAANIWAAWPGDLTLEDTATYLLGPVMGFVLLLRGCVSLHASAIVIDEHAVALAGPAGAGKSTTAAAFAEMGYRVLAEDVVTLDDRGDSFLIQPAYPCIRLWPASVEVLYGPNDLPRLTPNWDKRYLDLTQDGYDFQAHPLPLSGIYLLGERSDDKDAPLIREMTQAEALMSLIANTYATNLMDRQMRAREFELLSRMLKTVPVREIIPHASPAKISGLCRLITADFQNLKSTMRAQSEGQTVNV